MEELFTGRHVQSVKGGKVHYRSTASDAITGRAFPMCRSGRGGHTLPVYRDCDLPVDCTTCVAMHARSTAHRATPPPPAPTAGQTLYTVKYRGSRYTNFRVYTQATGQTAEQAALLVSELKAYGTKEAWSVVEDGAASAAAEMSAPVRHVNPDTVAGPRASRNATTEIAVRPIPGPTTPIRVDMRTMSAGVIRGPGWDAQLIRVHKEGVYYAMTLDADGEPEHVGRSMSHKEQAVAILARLMGVAGPLSINFQLSNV